MKGWINVHSANEEYQAEIIKSLLLRNGLTPVTIDRKDDGFRLGRIDIYVKPEEFEKSLELIKTNQVDMNVPDR